MASHTRMGGSMVTQTKVPQSATALFRAVSRHQPHSGEDTIILRIY